MHEEFCFIPRYNLKASAGFGSNASEEAPMFYMAFRKYWIKNHLNASAKDLAVISVKGDSMSGVLEDRDTILVNTAEHSPGEGLYVIRMGEDIFVKQLQRLPGGAVQVRSANPFVRDFHRRSAAQYRRVRSHRPRGLVRPSDWLRTGSRFAALRC